MKRSALVAISLSSVAAAVAGLESCDDCGVADCASGQVEVLVIGPGASPLNAPTVTLSGATTMTFDCRATADPQAMNCSSPDPVGPGDYTLTVAAPGFQPATVDNARVTESRSCGCVGETLAPSKVTLSPAP